MQRARNSGQGLPPPTPADAALPLFFSATFFWASVKI